MKQSSEGFESYFGLKSLKNNSLRFLFRTKKIENPAERVFDFSSIFNIVTDFSVLVKLTSFT